VQGFKLTYESLRKAHEHGSCSGFHSLSASTFIELRTANAPSIPPPRRNDAPFQDVPKQDALRSAFSNSHKALQVQHTRFPAIRPSRQTLDFDMMFRHLAYCLLALSSSVLAANICGTIGIHNGTKISYYMGNFFYKGPTSFALCALYCKKDTGRCKSFRYAYYSDAAGQYCEFFDNGL
jgi:hypothetical protein